MVLSVALCSKALSQVQFKSLQDVLVFADKHSYAIKSSILQQKVDISRSKQAQSYLYPSLNGVAGYNDNITLQPTLVPAKLFNPNAPEGTFEELVFGRQYVYNVGIQAQWDILNFQKKFTAQTANLQLESSKASTEYARYNLYNQLASTYYSILITRKSLDLYSENVIVTESLLESAKDKFKKGIISEAEVNLAAIQHLQNQKNKETALNNLQQLTIQLQSQLNTEEQIAIQDDIEQPKAMGTQITTANPEILVQESQIKINQSLVKQNKALYFPSLSIIYQYGYLWATDDFMNFDTANELSSQIFGLKMSIPIFNGFATKEKVNEAKAQLELQQLELENLKLTKKNEDETLVLQYEEAYQNLQKNKTIFELQKKNDIHSENKYKSGIISLDERLTKYGDLLTAQYNYLKSLSDFSISQYKIYIRQMDYQQNIFQ